MSYFVFEAPPQKRAKIHKESCPHCRSGQGQLKAKGGKVTDWYGPYDTLEQAVERAKRTRQPEVTMCGICRP